MVILMNPQMSLQKILLILSEHTQQISSQLNQYH